MHWALLEHKKVAFCCMPWRLATGAVRELFELTTVLVSRFTQDTTGSILRFIADEEGAV